MYRDRRPASDEAYLENMTRVIFLAGLGWKMIDEKWPNFKRAFGNFSIDEVAGFGENDLKRLISDSSIVRNRAKIAATLKNAKEFQDIKKRFGSFKSYLDSLDKSNNYALAVRELRKRFSRLGPTSARIFLYSVGEDVKHPREEPSTTP
jgi:3-methyladenine DNA glycosylase Tag